MPAKSGVQPVLDDILQDLQLNDLLTQGGYDMVALIGGGEESIADVAVLESADFNEALALAGSTGITTNGSEFRVMFLYEDIDLSELELPVVSSGGHIIVFGATSTEVFAAGREIDGQRKGAGGWVQRLLGQRVTARAWRTIERVVEDPV